jgi:uncharacterized protein DUF4339
MDAIWFYFEAGERRGPVTLDELVQALLASPEPQAVSVWREGLGKWQEAGSVPEISTKLPPPRPSIRPREEANRPVPLDDAEMIAKLYRRLVILVGIQILISLVQLPLQGRPSTGSAVLALLLTLILLGLLVAIAVMAYKLTVHLGSRMPVLWAIAMFLPCINIIGLLAISSKAQKWCQRYGIKVGLLGPTKESLEEVRRRAMTSHFD